MNLRTSRTTTLLLGVAGLIAIALRTKAPVRPPA
jgi:hypothetical protein